MTSKNNIPLITLSSDFAVQSQGIGHMESIIFSLAPEVRVIHLMHGIPEFNTTVAARTMETIAKIPVGIHVCVCDPGVGTKRKPIIIEVGRGDYFVGPDNGIFHPAIRVLGGATKIHHITNPTYMNQPVSHIFHGRDIFAPAAAYLATGIPITDFGPDINFEALHPASYTEATVVANKIIANIIQINKFGSVHLNILHQLWDEMGIKVGEKVKIKLPNDEEIILPVVNTFGEVSKGEHLILKDDYLRIAIAKNLGSFVGDFPLAIGDKVIVSLI